MPWSASHAQILRSSSSRRPSRLRSPVRLSVRAICASSIMRPLSWAAMSLNVVASIPNSSSDRAGIGSSKRPSAMACVPRIKPSSGPSKRRIWVRLSSAASRMPANATFNVTVDMASNRPAASGSMPATVRHGADVSVPPRNTSRSTTVSAGTPHCGQIAARRAVRTEESLADGAEQADPGGRWYLAQIREEKRAIDASDGLLAAVPMDHPDAEAFGRQRARNDGQRIAPTDRPRRMGDPPAWAHDRSRRSGRREASGHRHPGSRSIRRSSPACPRRPLADPRRSRCCASCRRSITLMLVDFATDASVARVARSIADSMASRDR